MTSTTSEARNGEAIQHGLAKLGGQYHGDDGLTPTVHWTVGAVQVRIYPRDGFAVTLSTPSWTADFGPACPSQVVLAAISAAQS